MCVCMTMKGISAKHLSKRPENHSLLEILKTNINRRPTSKSSSSAYTATYTAIPYVEFSPSAGRTDLVNEMLYHARRQGIDLLEILNTNINRRPTSKSSSSAYTATYTAIPYVEFSPSAGRTDLVNEMLYNASRQGLDLLEILNTHCIKAHGRSISLDFLFVCEFPKRLCADIVYNDTETQKMHIYTRHKDT